MYTYIHIYTYLLIWTLGLDGTMLQALAGQRGIRYDTIRYDMT